MKQKHVLPGLALIVASFLVPAVPNTCRAFNLQPGHLIVADSDNINLPNGAKILDINPTTGAQTLIASGGYLIQPTGLCLDSAGDIIVTDYGYTPTETGSIIRINPTTGQQTVLSTGNLLARPTRIAIDSQGSLIVSQEGLSGAAGAVLRVDPTTGSQAIIASGHPLNTPTGLAIDTVGNYFVSNFQGPGGSSILKIDPTSGAQSVVSMGGQLNLGPEGIWVNNTKANSLLVTEYSTGNPSQSALLDINALTGSQTVLSSGGFLSSPDGVTQDHAGNVFVTDFGKIVKINPLTGAQTTAASGGYLVTPTSIAVVVPEPPSFALLAVGAGLGLAAAVRCSQFQPARRRR